MEPPSSSARARYPPRVANSDGLRGEVSGDVAASSSEDASKLGETTLSPSNSCPRAQKRPHHAAGLAGKAVTRGAASNVSPSASDGLCPEGGSDPPFESREPVRTGETVTSSSIVTDARGDAIAVPGLTEELLQAQLELYHHCVALVKSMALKAATDLRVPDVIHRRGGAATLSDLAADTGIHHTKVAHLRRIMRVLTTSGGVFSIQNDDGGTAVYRLTLVSLLLVESSRTPMVGVLVDPFAVTALFSIPKWFTDERAAAVSLFEVAHGCLLHAGGHGGQGRRGVGSLVDVGGGHGAVAAAIATAFPQIRCTVLELPDVVGGAPADIGNVEFVVGDMFEYIPPADALLLKWIFHVWQDEDCVKILRQCKKAIPPRDAGGKGDNHRYGGRVWVAAGECFQ
ncbi:hypothetical protein ACQ4PT_013671 [Festuca glaucescens]